VEQNDDSAELTRRLGAQRLNIERVRFKLPPEKMSTRDFSLVTALCLPGGDDGKMGTHLPDDVEIEVQIRRHPEEQG
jgi:hypothetical protein